MDKNELIAKALEDRISQMVSQYERAMAEFRADATLRIGGLNEHIQRLQKRIEKYEQDEIAREDESVD
jgi:ABC-type uncharacterized transport system fused permease/ATPase subunit